MRDFVMFVSGCQDELRQKSPEQKIKWREECQTYFKKLERDHGHREGSQLKQQGCAIYVENGQTIVDGPFAETKEVLNGYIRFQAESFDAALALSKQFPSLNYGESVQVFETTSH